MNKPKIPSKKELTKLFKKYNDEIGLVLAQVFLDGVELGIKMTEGKKK